jgi:hypothetical protein
MSSNICGADVTSIGGSVPAWTHFDSQCACGSDNILFKQKGSLLNQMQKYQFMA